MAKHQKRRKDQVVVKPKRRYNDELKTKHVVLYLYFVTLEMVKRKSQGQIE